MSDASALNGAASDTSAAVNDSAGRARLAYAVEGDKSDPYAGFEARIIPEVGQVFSFHGFKFEIMRKQRNQIVALRITRQGPMKEFDDDTG